MPARVTDAFSIGFYPIESKNTEIPTNAHEHTADRGSSLFPRLRFTAKKKRREENRVQRVKSRDFASLSVTLIHALRCIGRDYGGAYSGINIYSRDAKKERNGHT